MLYKRVPPSISFGADLGRGVGFRAERSGVGLGIGFRAERSGAGLGVGFGTTFFIAGAGLLTVSSISGSLFSCESTATVWEGSLSTLVTVDTFDFWLMHPATRKIMMGVAKAIAKAVPLFILSSFGIGVMGCSAVLT